jgi:hypothetical protein
MGILSSNFQDKNIAYYRSAFVSVFKKKLERSLKEVVIKRMYSGLRWMGNEKYLVISVIRYKRHSTSPKKFHNAMNLFLNTCVLMVQEHLSASNINTRVSFSSLFFKIVLTVLDANRYSDASSGFDLIPFSTLFKIST